MDWILPAVVTIVSLAIVTQHAWAGKGHFASSKMPRGAVLLVVAIASTSIAMLFITWTQPAVPLAMLVGLVLELLSLALFWAAIRASREARLLLVFDNDPPHGIVRTGPYRLVRHPFYTSYSIFWTGWAIATWSAWSIPLWALMLAIYVVAARDEERKFAATAYAEEYRQYRERVGMFWPRFVR
jgi:protein-S-isoprenylcysteine O-methyltransferase Ste14